MPEPSNDRQEYLDYWLRQATKDLCVQARSRIRAEMEAHFDDAMAEALAAGLDEARVAHAAFVALGDPLVARHHFHQVYLTELDAQLMKDLVKEPSIIWKICDVLYCLLFLVGLNNTKLHINSFVDPYLVPAFALVGLVALASAVSEWFWPRLSNAWRVYHRVIIRLSYLLLLICSFLAPGHLMAELDPWIFWLFASSIPLVALMYLSWLFSIWLKLRRQQEAPR